VTDNGGRVLAVAGFVYGFSILLTT